MNKDRWFSTKLRFVIMVEMIGGDTLNDCIFLLRATDFDAAFNKALSMGEASQKQYKNSSGQNVQWIFMEIISLDVINFENLDGQEVYSEPIHLSHDNIIPFDMEFNPKTSKLLQTI